ncbi:hypothetical protein Cflav_PD6023 [Pedosphaera parvula Ellin514]|uniref:Core-binding (CB) domain-containing protein n=2 Tax=Pedosphaera TaxID=1032526 RepID=B9XA47_PEDPL|nr:hypothetical protein Cflav_PD6023 [Pedosphaera parvula Ellin514]
MLVYYEGNDRKRETFADPKDAKTRAEEVANKLSTGQAAALTLTENDKFAYVEAVKVLKPTGIPLHLAATEFAKAWEVLGGHSVLDAAKYFAKRHPTKLPSKMVSDVVREFIDSRTKNKKSKRYTDDLECRLGKFKKKFPTCSASIEAEQLKSFLDGLDLSARSYNNFKLALMSLFNYAKRNEYLGWTGTRSIG